MPFHPRIVHFPIALLLTAVLFTLIALLRPGQAWRDSAQRLLLLGWLSLLPVALSGLLSMNALGVDDPRRAAINPHITYFFATLIAFGLSLYLRLRRPDALDDAQWRWPYLATLALGTLFILLSGHTGGQLVFQLGVGVR